jgi:hypothetical protein
MATLLRLALERPELFRKPAPGSIPIPPATDIALIRRASLNDALNTIFRRIYPEVTSSDV